MSEIINKLNLLNLKQEKYRQQDLAAARTEAAKQKKYRQQDLAAARSEAAKKQGS